MTVLPITTALRLECELCARKRLNCLTLATLRVLSEGKRIGSTRSKTPSPETQTYEITPALR